MAIKVGGAIVIDDSRSLVNIGNTRTVNGNSILGTGDISVAPSSHVGATGAAHGTATAATAGFMSGADKTKLDGIAAGATAYSHPISHPPGIIVQDASNRFVTDAEKSSWNAKLSSVKTVGGQSLLGSGDLPIATEGVSSVLFSSIGGAAPSASPGSSGAGELRWVRIGNVVFFSINHRRQLGSGTSSTEISVSNFPFNSRTMLDSGHRVFGKLYSAIADTQMDIQLKFVPNTTRAIILTANTSVDVAVKPNQFSGSYTPDPFGMDNGNMVHLYVAGHYFCV